MCNKLKYYSPSAAIAAAELLNKKKKDFNIKQWYKCPNCPGTVIHLTSKNRGGNKHNRGRITMKKEDLKNGMHVFIKKDRDCHPKYIYEGGTFEWRGETPSITVDGWYPCVDFKIGDFTLYPPVKEVNTEKLIKNN